jgi:hypothetical protein
MNALVATFTKLFGNIPHLLLALLARILNGLVCSERT